MANLNKENIITVDVKNATVKTEGSMSFYVTDIKTCNIFCKLVTNEAKSTLVSNYAPIENAKDFSITLRLIKPNNEPKELEFVMLDETNAFFYVDLTDEYKDHAGTYKCELFVDCVTKTEDKEGNILKEELERITTSSFTYTVHKSIWSDLDDILNGGNPGQALIEKLATIAYVDDSISAIPESDLLNSYSTRKYVDESIDLYDNKIIRQDFASREYVNEIFNNIRYDIDTAGYATTLSVNESISALRTDLVNSFAPLSYVNDKILQINTSLLYDYPTKTYVDNQYSSLNSKLIEIQSKDYATKESVDEVSNDLLQYRNYVSEVFDDHWQDIEWIKQDWAKKEYVDEKISNAVMGNVDLTGYATIEYVHTAISNISPGGGEGGSVDLSDYVTKDYLHNRNYATQDYVDDSLMNLDYADKDYVNTAIDNAIVPDLSSYATKEYVDEAINSIETSGGSGGDCNCIFTIGNGSEEHIFSYDDIPDSMITDDPESFTQFTVLLKNVTVNYIDPNNYEQASKNYPDNIVTVIAMKQEGVKAVGIVEFNAINGSREMMMFAVDPESIMLMEGFTDELATVNNVAAIYATKTELNNKVDKTYVQSYVNTTLGDIESLLEEI